MVSSYYRNENAAIKRRGCGSYCLSQLFRSSDSMISRLPETSRYSLGIELQDSDNGSRRFLDDLDRHCVNVLYYHNGSRLLLWADMVLSSRSDGWLFWQLNSICCFCKSSNSAIRSRRSLAVPKLRYKSRYLCKMVFKPTADTIFFHRQGIYHLHEHSPMMFTVVLIFRSY